MQRILGSEVIFSIKHNGVWFPVSCLTESPIEESTEMIPTTTRINPNGWKSALPTFQSYNINISGIVMMDDSDSYPDILSYRKLRQKKRNRELIEWQLRTLGGYYIDEGFGHITSISHSDPVDGECAFQAAIQGFAEPTERDERQDVWVLGNERGEMYLVGELNLIKV